MFALPYPVLMAKMRAVKRALHVERRERMRLAAFTGWLGAGKGTFGDFLRGMGLSEEQDFGITRAEVDAEKAQAYANQAKVAAAFAALGSRPAPPEV